MGQRCCPSRIPRSLVCSSSHGHLPCCSHLDVAAVTNLSPAAQAVLNAAEFDLSPAARAVLQAVTWKKYDVPPEGLPTYAVEMAPLIAAALRAVADQVVPVPRLPYDSCCDVSATAIRVEILAIVIELEQLP